mmetsp:Transcript_107765/g.303629  ORF Transcript_107765/g.303629 Transcript_107765/m.303629 type:complete len:328 (-) Transcript_107765:41-1024(-)|eukprot:CAMPEP_0117472784 /NCGR_PEP_ID=MMETSP0784-20121206/8430_1 /TAXON_ID=39447 /ORGANISM="" /LENGTH=327 /DNA_ID=CAMNT_0005266955 /DNA_START=112 /DNA_END=1095 /DNA_ORIENTATION=+
MGYCRGAQFGAIGFGVTPPGSASGKRNGRREDRCSTRALVAGASCAFEAEECRGSCTASFGGGGRSLNATANFRATQPGVLKRLSQGPSDSQFRKSFTMGFSGGRSFLPKHMEATTDALRHRSSSSALPNCPGVALSNSISKSCSAPSVAPSQLRPPSSRTLTRAGAVGCGVAAPTRQSRDDVVQSSEPPPFAEKAELLRRPFTTGVSRTTSDGLLDPRFHDIAQEVFDEQGPDGHGRLKFVQLCAASLALCRRLEIPDFEDWNQQLVENLKGGRGGSMNFSEFLGFFEDEVQRTGGLRRLNVTEFLNLFRNQRRSGLAPSAENDAW